MSKWGVVKLVGSWKLESGVEKGDVREEKKGRLKKNIRKKKLLNMNLELWLSINSSFNLYFYFKSKWIDFKYGVF